MTPARTFFPPPAGGEGHPQPALGTVPQAVHRVPSVPQALRQGQGLLTPPAQRCPRAAVFLTAWVVTGGGWLGGWV
jgi:hypothetical protein